MHHSLQSPFSFCKLPTTNSFHLQEGEMVIYHLPQMLASRAVMFSIREPGNDRGGCLCEFAYPLLLGKMDLFLKTASHYLALASQEHALQTRLAGLNS